MSKRKWQEGEDYLELSPEELIKKNIFIPQEEVINVFTRI